ncbi:MAG: penicillin-binding protein 2 [Bacteroidetes bacterium]|nr:penicillin-binding protein 2 [Bacteroidota bacterium]MBU1718645.1 penicillin-binding protein 2 [Bacteroidota bacterium]
MRINTRHQDRSYIIIAIFAFVAVVFILRLFYIQVLVDKYKLSAENNVLRYVTIYPDRGLIFDRNGKSLVENEASYDLMVTPRHVSELDTLEFCDLLGIDTAAFNKRLTEAKNYSMYKSSVFEKEIPKEVYARFQEKLYKYNGFYIQRRTVRRYPHNIAPHLLGYIGEVNASIVEKDKYYKSGDYIGISGIEKTYEKYLRGRKGLRIMMVDVFNREKGHYKEGRYDTIALSGFNLTTTIDAILQEYGEKLMQNKKGSIVAIEPATGEILAMVSSPAYNPSDLVGRKLRENFSKLQNDTARIPLYNRALQAQYPPGSTFKTINALVGQQMGVININTRFGCAHGFTAGGLHVGCHGHASPLNLVQSIQHSCNAWYCNAFWAMIDRSGYKNSHDGFVAWRNHIMSFGFGKKFDDDLSNEYNGNIPTPEYYDKYHGAGRWKGLTIISLSIGQGEVLVTPLQLANGAAVIANRGYYYIPHVVKRIGDKGFVDPRFIEKHVTTVESKYYDPVVEGMNLVMEAGTGHRANLKGIPMCGKTGTAQNPHGKDHSIFVLFAPMDNPKIAVSVIVENSGFGATWAAPIASLMVEKYLTDTITRPDMEKRMFEGNLMGAK